MFKPPADGVWAYIPFGTIWQRLPFGIKLKYQFNDFCLLWDNLKRPALAIFNPYPLVAIGTGAADPFSLLAGCLAPSHKPPLNGLVFPAGHKKPKLKIFFVVFVCWVIGFEWRYNLGFGVLECLRNNALVYGFASGKAFYLNDKHSGPASGLHFL